MEGYLTAFSCRKLNFVGSLFKPTMLYKYGKLENLGFEVTLDPLGDSSLFADPLFSLQSPSKASDKNRGGLIDRQRKGVGVGAHSALVSKLVRFFN